jgi:ubiquinone biosynthesis protein
VCMEYLEGIKISDYRALQSNGFDLKTIAQRGFDAFFKQIFEWGYFHADPHPGNLIVMENNTLGIFDFGMIGQLSTEDRNALVEFVIALGRDDVERIVETIELLQGSEVMDRKGLERDLTTFINEFGSTAIKDIDLNEALNQGRSMAYRYKLKLNPDLFLLFRTISLLEGIGIGLDPQFRSLEAIKPYAVKLLVKQLNPKKLFSNNKELLFWAADWVQLLRYLPGDLRKLSTRIREDRIRIQTDNPSNHRLGNQIRYSAELIALSMGFGFSLLAFIYAEKVGNETQYRGNNIVQIFCAGFAALFGIQLLFKVLKRK